MESSRIFIRGLPPNFSHEDFKAHFLKQANVTDIKLIPHRRIGYVGYKTPEDAAKAVKYHNRTFIRMSRIGVELARSVEEQYTLEPVARATNGVKRKYGVSKGDTLKQPPGDTPCKQDLRHGGRQVGDGKAKLQEFLEVMQPPSKSKIWEDQAAPTAHIPKETTSLSEQQKTTKARSDEEYESVSKKQKGERKKTRRDKLANEPTMLQSTKLEELVHSITGRPSIAEQQTEEITYEAAATTQAASDADWLRSRTSRLLGLVDDGLALESAALPDDSVGQGTADGKPPQPSHSGDMSDASVQTDQDDRNEHSVEDAPLLGMEDTRPGNGRLFVRNLTYTTTEDDLRRHFESRDYGTIEEVSCKSLFYNCMPREATT